MGPLLIIAIFLGALIYFLSVATKIPSVVLVSETENTALSNVETVSLAEQLIQLDAIGLRTNRGVTIDDFLNSFSEEAFQSRSYDLVLYMLGIQTEKAPLGRFISDVAWNFDLEAIYGDGSYIEIVEGFLRISGDRTRFKNISDAVSHETGRAKLSYQVPERGLIEYTPKVNADWADQGVVLQIARDIEKSYKSEKRFFYKDNGQAIVLFFLTYDQRDRLTELGAEELQEFR